MTTPSQPTRVPEQRSKHGLPTLGEYKPRHVRWPGDKNPANPWPARLGGYTEDSLNELQPAEAWTKPKTSVGHPSQRNTPLVTEPRVPNSAALSRVPLTSKGTSHWKSPKPTKFDNDVLNWEIPLGEAPADTLVPLSTEPNQTPPVGNTPLTENAQHYSIVEKSPAAELPVIAPRTANSDYIHANSKGIWGTITDPQEGLPILGALSFLPLLGIPFGIMAFFIGVRKKNRPLRKRSERGFWAACTGVSVQGIIIGAWLTTYLWEWVMNDINTLYDLFM